MSFWGTWQVPGLVLLGGLLLVLLVTFMPLDDGSYDCRGDAITLTRNPLPEDNPPADGFHAEPACNQAARERMEQVVPWTAGLAAAAVMVSVAVAVARR